MGEFWRNWQDEKAMILWKTFNSFRYTPATRTAFGTYPPRVMISCGRSLKPDISKEDIEKLSPVTRERLENNFKKETGLKPGISLFATIKNYFTKLWYGSGKILGVSMMCKKPADKYFEIYNYVKFTTVEEYNKFLVGVFMSAGVIGKLNHKTEVETILETRKAAEEFIKQGYGVKI